VRSFWSTRRAILRGESLWDYEPSRLAENKYFGPWQFNAVQSAIAGSVAATSTKLLNLILPKAGTPEPKHFQDDPEFATLLETALGWIEPFGLPVFLTVLVFLMGWGSLKKEHSTPSSRARSRVAYLYLDGAYGFWSQLFLAFFIAAVSSELPARFAASFSTSVIIWPLRLLFLMLIAWQIYMTAAKTPRLLFVANNYSTRARRFGSRGNSTIHPGAN
jgi:hypothetical protein